MNSGVLVGVFGSFPIIFWSLKWSSRVSSMVVLESDLDVGTFPVYNSCLFKFDCSPGG